MKTWLTLTELAQFTGGQIATGSRVRMARAAFNARCETESFTWAKAGLFRESYRKDARAGLDALLGGEQE